jgi:hypothetical protein
MENTNYKKLYFKYKIKYINLKKQIGSGTELDKIKTEKTIIPLFNFFHNAIKDKIKGIRANPEQIINTIRKQYNDDELIRELNLIDNISIDDINENPNLKQIEKIFTNIFDSMTTVPTIDINYLPNGIKLLLKKMNVDGFIEKRTCTVHEFMTKDGVEKICNNPTLVKGSCGEPAFFNELYNETRNNAKIIELLNLIESKYEQDTNIKIILGSHEQSVNTTSFELYFNEITGYENINTVISKITNSSLIKPYYIETYFPTNIQGTNKMVLDKILEMTKKFKFKIINKICGSCFRSLYYLVQNSTNDRLKYEVNPLQGLSNQSDSSDIRTCWEYSRKKT